MATSVAVVESFIGDRFIKEFMSNHGFLMSCAAALNFLTKDEDIVERTISNLLVDMLIGSNLVNKSLYLISSMLTDIDSEVTSASIMVDKVLSDGKNSVVSELIGIMEKTALLCNDNVNLLIKTCANLFVELLEVNQKLMVRRVLYIVGWIIVMRHSTGEANNLKRKLRAEISKQKLNNTQMVGSTELFGRVEGLTASLFEAVMLAYISTKLAGQTVNALNSIDLSKLCGGMNHYSYTNTGSVGPQWYLAFQPIVAGVRKYRLTPPNVTKNFCRAIVGVLFSDSKQEVGTTVRSRSILRASSLYWDLNMFVNLIKIRQLINFDTTGRQPSGSLLSKDIGVFVTSLIQQTQFNAEGKWPIEWLSDVGEAVVRKLISGSPGLGFVTEKQIIRQLQDGLESWGLSERINFNLVLESFTLTNSMSLILASPQATMKGSKREQRYSDYKGKLFQILTTLVNPRWKFDRKRAEINKGSLGAVWVASSIKEIINVRQFKYDSQILVIEWAGTTALEIAVMGALEVFTTVVAVSADMIITIRRNNNKVVMSDAITVDTGMSMSSNIVKVLNRVGITSVQLLVWVKGGMVNLNMKEDLILSSSIRQLESRNDLVNSLGISVCIFIHEVLAPRNKHTDIMHMPNHWRPATQVEEMWIKLLDYNPTSTMETYLFKSPTDKWDSRRFLQASVHYSIADGPMLQNAKTLRLISQRHAAITAYCVAIRAAYINFLASLETTASACFDPVDIIKEASKIREGKFTNNNELEFVKAPLQLSFGSDDRIIDDILDSTEELSVVNKIEDNYDLDDMLNI